MKLPNCGQSYSTNYHKTLKKGAAKKPLKNASEANLNNAYAA